MSQDPRLGPYRVAMIKTGRAAEHRNPIIRAAELRADGKTWGGEGGEKDGGVPR